MADRNIQFIVKRVVNGESGRYTVIGRCGDDPVRVGDVFSLVLRYKKGSYPKDAEVPPERESEQHVNLRVQGVHAYDKDLEELGPGMTGSLSLEGMGACQVAPGTVLGIPCPICNT